MSATAGSSNPPSFQRALRSRPFFLLWLSQLVSQSGDFIFEVALLWLVLDATGSVLAVGVVVGATVLPSVLFGPFLGVYVDRWNRRTILWSTNVIEGVVVAALSGLVLAHEVGLGAILLIVFVLGTGAQMVRTASTAMVPEVVGTEDLPPANGLLSFSSSLNQVVGLSLGGVVVALLGINVPIEYDALTFFAAALIVAAIPRGYSQAPKSGVATPGRFRTEFTEGLRFIRQNRFLLELILLGAVVNFFATAALALLAPYAKLALHGGPATYGFLGAFVAFGAIVGALVVGKIDTRRTAGTYLFSGGLAIGVLIASIGLTTTTLVAFAVMFALGVAVSLTNIPIVTVIQAKVPGRLLGRVLGAFLSFVSAGAPLGAFFAGAFAAATSVRTVFVVSGVVVIACMAVAALGMREIRTVAY